MGQGERALTRPRWDLSVWTIPWIRDDILVWTGVALATLIAAISFAFRLPAYDFGRDDAVTALVANLPVARMLDLVAHHEPNPAGYYLFMHLWPHQTEVLARIPGYLAALLAIPLTAWLAQRMQISVIAATGLTFASPFLAYMASEVRAYAILVLFSVVVLLLTWDAITVHKVPWPVLCGVLALSLYFHYFMAFLVAAALLALWLWAPSRTGALRAAAVVVALFIPGMVMLAIQLPAMRAMAGGGWQPLLRGPGIWDLFKTLFAFQGSNAAAYGLAGLVALATVAGVATATRTRAGRMLILFAGVQLLPLLPAAFIKFLAPWYVCGALVPMLLLAAMALTRLRVLAALVLIPVTLGLFIIWTDAYGFDGFRPPVKAALAALPPDIPVVVGRGTLAASVAYYGGERVSVSSVARPRIDYLGLWALPRTRPMPTAQRMALFELCSAPPVVLPGYQRDTRIAYLGNLCVELQHRSPTPAAGGG